MSSKVVSAFVIKISDLSQSQKRMLFNGAPHYNNIGALRGFCNGLNKAGGPDVDEETARRLLRKVQKRRNRIIANGGVESVGVNRRSRCRHPSFCRH